MSLILIFKVFHGGTSLTCKHAEFKPTHSMTPISSWEGWVNLAPVAGTLTWEQSLCLVNDSWIIHQFTTMYNYLLIFTITWCKDSKDCRCKEGQTQSSSYSWVILTLVFSLSLTSTISLSLSLSPALLYTHTCARAGTRTFM